mmetsp:Transcript_69906/g.218191  ORF Transcript_69906/g.218191 Transcript_69906/m.218191 type:complete len:294 (+) Transcript_69906:134-1015(+)
MNKVFATFNVRQLTPLRTLPDVLSPRRPREDQGRDRGPRRQGPRPDGCSGGGRRHEPVRIHQGRRGLLEGLLPRRRRHDGQEGRGGRDPKPLADPMRDRPIAKQYVEEAMKELPEDQRVKHLKIMLFSEIETDAIVDGVLKPALAKIGFSDSDAMKLIFGVEGEYGRHYSFLKAVLAIYHAFIDPAVTATFKIDIDQVFVQDSLVSETGKSMLEHFKSDLWGAKRRRSRTSPTPRTSRTSWRRPRRSLSSRGSTTPSRSASNRTATRSCTASRGWTLRSRGRRRRATFRRTPR